MRRVFIALILASGLAQASAIAQSATPPKTLYATSSVILHRSPSATSPRVASIALGTKLLVAKCASGWCEVAEPTRHGFVPERSLSVVAPRAEASGPQARSTVPPTTTGKGYTNSQGAHVASPTRTESGKPPAGATAQCRDSTYSFSQSRRGTCSHHGGVSRWLLPN